MERMPEVGVAEMAVGAGHGELAYLFRGGRSAARGEDSGLTSFGENVQVRMAEDGGGAGIAKKSGRV